MYGVQVTVLYVEEESDKEEESGEAKARHSKHPRIRLERGQVVAPRRKRRRSGAQDEGAW